MWREIGRGLIEGGKLLPQTYNEIEDRKYTLSKREQELQDMIAKRIESKEANFRQQQEEARRQREFDQKKKQWDAAEAVRQKELDNRMKMQEQAAKSAEKKAAEEAKQAIKFQEKANTYTEKTAQTLDTARQQQGIPTQPGQLPEVGVQGGWGTGAEQIMDRLSQDSARAFWKPVDDQLAADTAGLEDLESTPPQEQTFEPWDAKRRAMEEYNAGAISGEELQKRELELADRAPGGRYSNRGGQNRGNADVAKTISEKLKTSLAENPNFSRKNMLQVILDADPSGTFIGTQDGGRLLSAVSPQEAIRRADLAAKKFDYEQEEDDRDRTNKKGMDYVNTANQLADRFESTLGLKELAKSTTQVDAGNSLWKQYQNKEISPYAFDQSIGYFFNKTLDASSVVMPGEFQRVTAGKSWGDKIKAWVSAGFKGGLSLTDNERSDMVKVMNETYNSAKQTLLPVYKYYLKSKERYRIDPYDVIRGYGELFDEKLIPSMTTPKRDYSNSKSKGGIEQPQPAPQGNFNPQAARKKYNY